MLGVVVVVAAAAAAALLLLLCGGGGGGGGSGVCAAHCSGEPTHEATAHDTEGPYFVAGAPWRDELVPDDVWPAAPRLHVSGVVHDRQCRHVAGDDTLLHVWNADADGQYSQDTTYLRGRLRPNATGHFHFSTVLPGRYGAGSGFRPAHVHVKVEHAALARTLTTQLYFAGDPFLGSADSCGPGCASDEATLVVALREEDGGKRFVAQWDITLDMTLPTTATSQLPQPTGDGAAAPIGSGAAPPLSVPAIVVIVAAVFAVALSAFVVLALVVRYRRAAGADADVRAGADADAALKPTPTPPTPGATAAKTTDKRRRRRRHRPQQPQASAGAKRNGV